MRYDSRGRFEALWVAAIVLWVAPAGVWAGAWSRAPGSYYAKVSGLLYHSEDFFNDMGRRAPMGMDGERFRAGQSFLYLEYGLRDRLTLVSSLSAGRLVSEDQFVESTTWGVGDVEVGIKYQLSEEVLVVAPQFTLKVPSGYNADFDPSMGTGEIDAEARLLVSRSLYPLPVYFSAELGYRKRGGVYSGQIPYVVEAGITPHQRLFAKIFWSGTDTRRKDESEASGIVGLAQVSEGDFLKAGAQLAIGITEPLWLDVLYERIVDGENIGAGTTWGIGLSVAH
jgi:protein XagA